MPFLVPAVASAASDVLILYLTSQRSSNNHDGDSDGNDDAFPIAFIYHVKYLAPLAAIRLLFVLLPFSYHSYTGTAIQCPLGYQLFYAATLCCIVGHILCIIMLDPDSLKVGHPTWAVLFLSLVSVLFHITLVCHVRSSAPSTFDQRKHVLYYYATMTTQHDDSDHLLPTFEEPNATTNSTPTITTTNGSNPLLQQIQPEGYDEFMLDLHNRLSRTKHEWTMRLQDFTRRLDTHESSTFSVLLQLFAYEDVLESGKLDACESLILYVPQLLSFLLHGAYDKTPQLEAWLLQTCRDNVLFAHRCVWFLQAWCLETVPVTSLTPSSSVASFKSASSVTSLVDHATTNTRYAPHERDSVQALLFRVMECGQVPAMTDMATTTPTIEASDIFLSTPNFLDALMAMADGLFLISRERRTEELRAALRALDTEFLPSQAIYMPVSRSHHWTWKIVPEESIAISTKERVPCIVCLEVMDYHVPLKKSLRKRSLLDTFRKESSDASSLSPTSPLPPQDGTEWDMVDMWKTSVRNPYRHSSLLDKVTNFTNDSLKRFREKNPKEALFWAENGIMDLMKPLTRATSLTRTTALDDPSALEAPVTPPNTKRPMTPTTAMGQWSSPVTSPPQGRLAERKKKRMVDEDDEAMDVLLKIRNHNERREDTPPYGSTAPPLDRKVRPPPVVFKESWETKQERIRATSVYGSNPNWRLLPILIKSNDDLRQEQLASQLIYRMAAILAMDRIPVWLCPYEIVALSNRGGIIEAIPDTISIASLKKNDPTYTSLAQFFLDHFDEGEDRENAKANFVESLAAYSIVCFILQIKDRHNGNILLDTCGHLIHIDFGFFFLSSPGKNSGFESAPFKLTRDFVDVMDGPHSFKFRTFRELCCRTFLSLRKHCLEITLLVEMVSAGNEELACFRGRPEDAVQGLRERFRLDLNDRACQEYVNALIDESLENWRTRWYDRYQRFCVGVL